MILYLVRKGAEFVWFALRMFRFAKPVGQVFICVLRVILVLLMRIKINLVMLLILAVPVLLFACPVIQIIIIHLAILI